MISLITKVLRAYAAGDAFGVFYEFQDGKNVTAELQTLDGWPLGGVSDDSLLTLMTLATLTEPTPSGAADKFLEELRKSAPKLRGLGPTTRHALGIKVKDSETHLIGGSNGAMMRTALCGLAFTQNQSNERREYVAALAQTTHSSYDAINCAQIAASLFSSQDIDITSVVLEEYPEARTWSPPQTGISLNPVETLFAFTMVASRNTKALDAYVDACRLGGDTDTVSALAGALVTFRNSDSDFEEIPWLSKIDWNEISQLNDIAIQIASNR